MVNFRSSPEWLIVMRMMAQQGDQPAIISRMVEYMQSKIGNSTRWVLVIYDYLNNGWIQSE